MLDKIFLDESAGFLAGAYWRWLLLSAWLRDAKRFAADLRRPPAASDAPAARQFIERIGILAAECAGIDAEERALREMLFNLYRLSPNERNLVENDRPGLAAAPASG